MDSIDDLFVDGSKSELPFAAEPFRSKSGPPLADDEFVPKTFKAREVVVTAETLESEEFVLTAVVVIAELVLMAFSPVVVDSSFVASVLGEVKETLAVLLEELEEL